MRILRIGSTGPAVQLLQLALNRAGFGPLETDGIFGPLTEAALRRFQSARGILSDGVAGRETHRALLPWYTGSLLHRIEKGDTIAKLAQRYGTTTEAIFLANPEAEAENLRIGESLVIPLPFPVVPTTIGYSARLTELCLQGLNMRYPFLETGEIGHSVMGRPIRFLRLGRGENKVLYNAEHHANEWITTPLLLKFTEELCAAFAAGGSLFGQSAAEIFSYARICLVPLVNPDGVDLVTGELQRGERYEAARAIAARWPEIPFPSGWKANIAGTDLNLQYPAEWETARAVKFEAGYTAPAPMNYVGPAPLSTPESRALADLTRRFGPALVQAWHTQGGVIYWRFGGYEVPGAQDIAGTFAAVSGYTPADTPYAASFAGYKDFFIQEYRRPGFTIEAGRGVNPLPIGDFDSIYAASRGILTLGALVT